MSKVYVNVDEAVVTAVREFNNKKGYGINYFIEAQSSYCTVHLQIVLFDDTARSYRTYIREGDSVKVTGFLKDKPYVKNDGTAGHSLLVERPFLFEKLIRRNSEPQLQNQNDSFASTEYDVSQTKNEVSAYASAAAIKGSKDEEHCISAEYLQSEELQPPVPGVPRLKTFTDDSGHVYECYDIPDVEENDDVPF